MKYCLHTIVLLLALVLAACGGSSRSTLPAKELYKPAYAGAFRILGDSLSQNTVISVSNPWQGAEGVRRDLLVLREGEAPAGFDGQIMRGDARRIVAMSSTHVAMLSALGLADRIVGVSGLDFISDPAVLARRESITDVGSEGNVDYERLLASRPDLVLLYGVSGASVMEGKLRELGIPYMYVGDYIEESPLGKAEWLVAIAEACGVRDKGVGLFRPIPSRYEALRRKVADAGLPAPSVMLNTPYSGNWFMPSSRSYMCLLIKDAGASPVYDRDTGSKSATIDMEQACLLASRADFWLNPGQAASLADIRAMAPKLASLPLLTSGKVFNNNKRSTSAGGNDFYESAIVRPDTVLADLISIFHPGLIDHNPVYYRPLR